jgi:hypothetical protein
LGVFLFRTVLHSQKTVETRRYIFHHKGASYILAADYTYVTYMGLRCFVFVGLIPASKLVPTFPASSLAAPAGGYIAPAGNAQTLLDLSTPNFGVWSVSYL